MFLPFAVPWMPFYVQCDIVALVQGSPPKPRDHIFFERSQAEGSVELLKSRAVRGSLRICLRHGYLPRFFFFLFLTPQCFLRLVHFAAFSVA